MIWPIAEGGHGMRPDTDVELLAEAVRRDTGAHEVPLDAERLVAAIRPSIELVYEPRLRLRQTECPALSAVLATGHRIILVNPDVKGPQRSMAIATALGHLFMRDHDRAEAFASALLVPRAALLLRMRSGSHVEQSLADAFNVPVDAIRHRLRLVDID